MDTAPDSAGANSRPKLPRGGDGNGEDFVQARNGQQTCRQVQRGRPSRRRGLQPAHSHDRPGRQAPADAGAESPLGARLAPRQAPSVIGAFPRRALFDFQSAFPEGGVQDARAGMCARLVRPQVGKEITVLEKGSSPPPKRLENVRPAPRLLPLAENRLGDDAPGYHAEQDGTKLGEGV